MPDLLLEFLSEEIPARMQPKARDDLMRLMEAELKGAGLVWRAAKAFSTPRRLTLMALGLPTETESVVEERKGPRADASQAAVDGFLRSTGLRMSDLHLRDDGKGPVYFAVTRKPGRRAADAIAEAVSRVARAFPWPKSMRWGSGDLRWVRPLRSLICLLGDEVVPVSLEGVPCGRVTRGHRVHGPQPFEVAGCEDYATKLMRAGVILDQDARKKYLREESDKLAKAAGFEILPDENLLDEAAGLVEWPVPILGRIEPEFQDLPPEVLQTSMREHQKYFALREASTPRIVAFIAAANLRAADGGALMRAGYERVLKARLSDARFFWENDLATPLEARLPKLDSIVFHARLGAQGDRIGRMRALAGEIGEEFGADAALVDRAALLAKADLVTDMVGEFPELQGRMGRRYAEAAGEHPAVSGAIEEHYRPVGASDRIPRDAVAASVAIADKLDMLVCFWTIDEKPTGSKDPFALRRAALGIIRILVDGERRLNLRDLAERHYFLAERARQHVEQSERGEAGAVRRNLSVRVLDRLYEGDETAALAAASLDRDKSLAVNAREWSQNGEKIAHDLMKFIADRLTVYLRDMGLRHDIVAAALGEGGADDPLLATRRARALALYLESPQAANLTAAYKRAANILKVEERKEAGDFSRHPDPSQLALPAEKALYDASVATEREIEDMLAQNRFDGALAAMARLRAPLDAFFNDVTVNAEDPALRRNRLRLLSRIRALMKRVADFDALEG